MKPRYRLIRRGERGAKFYWVDGETGRRTSLGAAGEAEAMRRDLSTRKDTGRDQQE